MKIGIDASRANRDQKTGVEWYAFLLIQELKNIIPSDVEVILYSRRPLAGKLAELPSNWKEKVLVWPPKFLWTQVRMSWEMIVQAPDVLFIPSHIIPIIHPKNTVVTMHDVAWKFFPEAYTWKGRTYHQFGAKFGAKYASKIITISQSSANDIIKYYPAAKDKINITPLAYDTKNYKIIENDNLISEAKAKYALTKPYLMSIGRLETKKNTDKIILAFNEVKKQHDVQLLLVGQPRPGRGYELIEKLINESPYKDDIKIPGWAPQDDIPVLMNGAKLFLFPSKYEGFGIPILEAMACGCPVITSNITACPEVAGNAAVLIDPNNIDQISRQLLKLIKDNDFREEIIKRGLEKVGEFSWEKTARESWEIIQGKKNNDKNFPL